MSLDTKIDELNRRDLTQEFRKICKNYGVLLDEIFSMNRDKAVVSARKDIAIYLRKELGWGFVAIGKLLDRDHSSIMYAVNGRKDRRQVAA